jgi:ankyrin repeat protein
MCNVIIVWFVTGTETLINLIKAREENNICRAIGNNDLDTLEAVLVAGSNDDRESEVNVRLSTGETPLLFALLKKNVQVVRSLLQHGADVNLEGAYYRTEPDISEKCVSCWLSPASAAVDSDSVDIAEAVFDNFCGVVYVGCYEWEKSCTLAIKQHAVHLLDLLVEKWKPTPGENVIHHLLDLAIQEGVCAIVESLLRVVDLSSDGGKHTHLAAAAMRGRVNICQLLIKHGASVHCHSDLDLVVECGSVRCLDILWSLGCRYRDDDEEIIPDKRPLGREDAVLVAVSEGHIPIVKRLVQRYGPSLIYTSVDGERNTVVHKAAIANNSVMLNELLTMIAASGYNVDDILRQRNVKRNGRTPLQCSLKSLKNWSRYLPYRSVPCPLSKYDPFCHYFLICNFTEVEHEQCWKLDAMCAVLEVFVKWRADFGKLGKKKSVLALGVVVLSNRPDILLGMVNCHFDLPACINETCHKRKLRNALQQ